MAHKSNMKTFLPGLHHAQSREKTGTNNRPISLFLTEIQYTPIQEANMDSPSSKQPDDANMEQLLTNLSREMRMPLNAIIGLTNVLRKNSSLHQDMQASSYLNRMLSDSKYLLTLLDGIQELFRIQAGKEPLKLEKFSLPDLLEEVKKDAQAFIGDKKIHLFIEIPETVAPMETDRGKLKQCILGLIKNAWRLTDKGSITLRVLVEPDTRIPICLDVKDTGIGIPEDKLEQVFMPFQQICMSYRTGLELQLVRSICQLMGYNIRVRSEVGQGTTFSILLTNKQHSADEQITFKVG